MSDSPQNPNFETIFTLAQRIKAEDVLELHFCFYAPLFNLHVTDKQIIELFLKGLRNHRQEGLAEVAYQPDTMRIVVKPGLFPGSERLLFFRFWAISAYLIGQDFENALHARARYMMQQVHQSVPADASELEIIYFGVTPIQEREKMERVLEALRQVDERAFAYTEEHPFFSVEMRFRSGKSVEFHFALSRQPEQPSEKPLLLRRLCEDKVFHPPAPPPSEQF